MRITIIVGYGDNSVYLDGVSRGGLDLSQCDLPNNFWAFQWNQNGDNTGEIEYDSPMVQNDRVTEIPAWVTACIAVLQAKLDQEAAEQAAEAEAARIAAEQATAEQIQQGV